MALFTAFPAQDRSGTEGELAQIYLMALDGVSVVAVERAVRRFIRGEVDDNSLTFRPTPAQLSKEARRIHDHLCVIAERDQRIEENRKRIAAPPEKPEAERKAIVEQTLGYNPADARAVRRARQDENGQDMFKKAGLTASEARNLEPAELLNRVVDKSKPHWNPGSREHSHRTPEEIVAALGDRPLK